MLQKFLNKLKISKSKNKLKIQVAKVSMIKAWYMHTIFVCKCCSEIHQLVQLICVNNYNKGAGALAQRHKHLPDEYEVMSSITGTTKKVIIIVITKIELPYDPKISLLSIFPKETKSACQRYICINLFIASSITISKIWKQPKCSLTYEWVNKMWHPHPQ